MARLSTINSLHRQRGSLMVELLVALAILTGVLLPLAYSFVSERRLARSAYQRAVAMEIVDGEMEVLLAGGCFGIGAIYPLARALKKAGNRIVSILGGRPIHPVSVRVGGFSKAPTKRELQAMRADLDAALGHAIATVDWVSTFVAPEFEREERFVSLRHPDEYPMNDGRIVSSDGVDLAPTDWESAFHEEQVPWSHALQSHMGDRIPYLLGPAARITLAGDRLHPEARAALDRIGLAEAIRRNPYWSIAARAVELVHAVAEAIDIVDGYVPPEVSARPYAAGPGRACWATEAP